MWTQSNQDGTLAYNLISTCEENEDGKPEDRSKLAGRIMLLQQVISVGLKELLKGTDPAESDSG